MERRTALRHELSLVPVLGVMMLAACAAPDAGQAVKPIPVSTLGLGRVSRPNIDATWWSSLGDPQLARIIRDALSGCRPEARRVGKGCVGTFRSRWSRYP